MSCEYLVYILVKTVSVMWRWGLYLSWWFWHWAQQVRSLWWLPFWGGRPYVVTIYTQMLLQIELKWVCIPAESWSFKSLTWIKKNKNQKTKTNTCSWLSQYCNPVYCPDKFSVHSVMLLWSCIYVRLALFLSSTQKKGWVKYTNIPLLSCTG